MIQEPEGAGWETSHCGRLAGRPYTTHRSTVLRSTKVGDWRGWWRPARGQKCPGNRRIHSQSGLERVFVPIRLKLHTLRHLSTYWKIHPHFSSPNSWLYAEGRTYRPMTHLLHANLMACVIRLCENNVIRNKFTTKSRSSPMSRASGTRIPRRNCERSAVDWLSMDSKNQFHARPNRTSPGQSVAAEEGTSVGSTSVPA